MKLSREFQAADGWTKVSCRRLLVQTDIQGTVLSLFLVQAALVLALPTAASSPSEL
jgi:hypothetical protein